MNSNLLSYSASNTCITQCVLEERIVNKITNKIINSHTNIIVNLYILNTEIPLLISHYNKTFLLAIYFKRLCHYIKAHSCKQCL